MRKTNILLAAALCLVMQGASAQVRKIAQAELPPPDTVNPPIITPDKANEIKFAIESFCLSNSRLVEKLAIMRDVGVAEPKALEFMLKDEKDQKLLYYSGREVRWVYTNIAVEPAVARQMRYINCMANPPY